MIYAPSLDFLKQKLQVQPVNTGRQFTHNGQANGIVFDDREGLYGIIGTANCIHIKSDAELSTIQYRGQNEDFGVCNSKLDRCATKEEQFLSICRTIAFEELLEVHPFIIYVRSLRLLDENHFCVNLTGMAQHYGLHTDYIDITTNFDVACFFATCEYIGGKYRPIGNASYLGVLYVIHEAMMPPFVENQYSQKVCFEYLGWQPLPRPEQQRASVLKIAKDTHLESLTGVEKHYFKHSICQSKKIWERFNKGRALFPDDSAADLANECSKLTSFTSEQVRKAFERLETWSMEKIDNKERIIDSSKIEIVKNNHLSWGNLVETNPKYWEKKFDETKRKLCVRSAYI